MTDHEVGWWSRQVTFGNVLSMATAISVGTALYLNLTFADRISESRLAAVEKVVAERGRAAQLVAEHEIKLAAIALLARETNATLTELQLAESGEHARFDRIEEVLAELRLALDRLNAAHFLGKQGPHPQ